MQSWTNQVNSKIGLLVGNVQENRTRITHIYHKGEVIELTYTTGAGYFNNGPLHAGEAEKLVADQPKILDTAEQGRPTGTASVKC